MDEIAISSGKTAETIDEIPIGAVIVKNGKIISTGFNTRESLNKTFGHAEIEAIHSANISPRILELNCEIFVTLEPCIMCAATLQQLAFKRVIFGAKDKKEVEGIPLQDCGNRLNHSFSVTSGVLARKMQRHNEKLLQK